MEEAKSEMIAFYNVITDWINEGRAVNVVCLGFSQAFDTVCHDILIDKLRKCELDEPMVRWIESRRCQRSSEWQHNILGYWPLLGTVLTPGGQHRPSTWPCATDHSPRRPAITACCEVMRGGPAPLLSPGSEATSGVLWPVLVSSVHGRHGAPRASPEEGNEDDGCTGAPHSWGEPEGAGTV